MNFWHDVADQDIGELDGEVHDALAVTIGASNSNLAEGIVLPMAQYWRRIGVERSVVLRSAMLE